MDVINSNLGFRPIGQRLLVKKPVLKKEETTTSGIVIPQTAKSASDHMTIAEVLATGDEVTNVRVGDIIKFENPHPVKFKDEEYFLINERNVLLILDEPLT